jgi:hypothetical protein
MPSYARATLQIVAESAVKLLPAAGVWWAPTGPVADGLDGREDSFAPDWRGDARQLTTSALMPRDSE